MNASVMPIWEAIGRTRQHTHFSRLTGDAQANAAAFSAFGEVVLYQGDLVIGKKPGQELYFVYVDGVEYLSDLESCENALFGHAESYGTLPEMYRPTGLQRHEPGSRTFAFSQEW